MTRKTNKMTVAELEEFCRKECQFFLTDTKAPQMRWFVRGSISGMYRLWRKICDPNMMDEGYWDSLERLKDEFPIQ